MTETTQTRKADHIRICLEEDVQFRQQTSGFEQYRFSHAALPELDYADIDLSGSFLGKTVRSPLLISSMTGGTEQAQMINQRLAIAAQANGLAMGVGSQRVAVEKPEVWSSFQVRKFAPDVLLFANLGAVQLNYTYGIEQCRQVVEGLEADALILHINPLQECIQPNGDRNFAGLLAKIATICEQLPVPVIAKEVGNGISARMAQQLIEAGVGAIDVAGAGGTSWAKVEAERAGDPLLYRLGQTFADWGIPTAECVTSIRGLAPHIPLIASGGLRNGLEAAKAIAIGANLAGFAFPFLKAAMDSPEAIQSLVDVLNTELTTAMFCTGCRTLENLRQDHVIQKI